MPRYVEDAPAAVLATAKEMAAKGLVEGTAGNISARQADGNVCITPSSIDYREMEADAEGRLSLCAPDRIASPALGDRTKSIIVSY